MDKKDENTEEKDLKEQSKKEKADAVGTNDSKDSGEELEPESEEQPKKYFHPSPSSDLYAGSHSRSGKKMPFLLGIAIIILILGGLFYFLKARPKASVEPSPSSATIAEESTPQPSPTPEFDRSKYTLRVLNGTSTQGLAASTSAKLKDLGYNIERTVNATNSAFLKTIIRVKPNLEELLENLLKDLAGIDIEGEEGPELKDSDTSGGEVILGSQ
ncbi:MAG: LytR C-terminal domain-containing protein [Patescibacteria group bacterium]